MLSCCPLSCCLYLMLSFPSAASWTRNLLHGSYQSLDSLWALVVELLVYLEHSCKNVMNLVTNHHCRARISTKEERLKYVAWNSLVQYIGFTLSPILSQAVKLALPKMENKALLYGFIPGMIMVVLSTIMIFVLLLMRPNDPVPEPETIVDSDTLKSEPEAVKTPEDLNPSEEKNTAHERKLWACFILYLFLNFVLRGILGILETFGILLICSHLSNKSKGAQQFQTLRTQGSRIDEDVVDDSAEFFVIMGCLGIGTFLILPRMVKKFTPFYVLLFGIACISIASVLLIPHILRDDFWYMFVPAVFMIWSVGSPITQTLTISSYSQMMGSKPQGEAMGWLSTAGSLGRIVFPFLGGISYLLIAWINLIFSILCIIAVILFRVYYGLDS